MSTDARRNSAASALARRTTRRARHGAPLATLLAALAMACADGRLAPHPGAARAAGEPRPAALASALDEVLAETGAPGGIVGVQAGSRPFLAVARGLADRESGRRLAADDPYFQGSVTKVYTAVVVLRLAEEGRLSLDDTLDRYFPSFPDGERITVRHLLAQTSGLKDFYLYLYLRPDRDEMIEMVTRRWSQQELIGLSSRFGRYFEPGTDWDYSSTNYFLLGVIAERVSGLTLPAAFERYVYAPLGLARSWIHQHEPARGTLPTGYMGTVEAWKHSAMFGELGATTVLDRSSAEWSAGGLVAPASEAVRFLTAVVDGDLLRPQTRAEMQRFRDTPRLGSFTADPAAPEKPDGYGLGLIRMELPGHTLVGHGGLYNGHTAGLWHVVGHDVTFALYLNRGFIDQRKALGTLLPVLTTTRARSNAG